MIKQKRTETMKGFQKSQNYITEYFKDGKLKYRFTFSDFEDETWEEFDNMGVLIWRKWNNGVGQTGEWNEEIEKKDREREEELKKERKRERIELEGEINNLKPFEFLGLKKKYDKTKS